MKLQGRSARPGKHKLALEGIRRTAGHASDVAQAMSKTIDEVIERHGKGK